MTTREELTRHAEKCLRQGRLDEAITLYQQLADLFPADWGVVKLLADLLERAGQREAASAQFARWADYLFAEGFHSKAAALFKKVLKLEPNHEHALWQLGEVSVALKLRADARVAFGRVADLRQRRNDVAGATEARQRLAELEAVAAPMPASTVGTPRQWGVAAEPSGEPGEAHLARLHDEAAPLERASTLGVTDAEADRPAVLPAAAIAPPPMPNPAAVSGSPAWPLPTPSDDDAVNGAASRAALADGDAVDQPAESAASVPCVLPGAVDGEGPATGPAPDDWLAAVETVASTPGPAAVMGRSDFDWADLLGRDLDGGDDAVEAVAPSSAPAIAARGVVDESSRADEGWRQGASGEMPLESARGAGRIVDLGPRHARTDQVLPASVGTGPGHATAAALGESSSASAPISDGRVPASTVAPAAVAHVPPPGAAPGPDAVIDEEIDLTQLLEDLKPSDPVLPEPHRRSTPGDHESVHGAGAQARAAVAQRPSVSPPMLEAAPADPPGRRAPAAVHELSIDEETVVADAVSAALDEAFARLPRESDDRVVAEQQLAAGRVFLAAGLTAEAARSFERACREPRTRFESAEALAGLHRSRGQLAEAVRWFESAAAAPVPDAAVKRSVLYDLAESLEALGESDRALGVLLDLLSQVEDYRDARGRLDRLLRVDAGG